VMWFRAMQSTTVMTGRSQTEQPAKEIPYRRCKNVIEMTSIILTENVADKELWMVMMNAFRQRLVKRRPVKKRTKQLPVTDRSIIETVGH